MKYFNKNIQGFTLMELTIALSLFVVIMSVSAGILLHSIRTSRRIADQIRGIDNSFLAIEQMAREIRTGYNITFNPQNNMIQFITFDGAMVSYNFCGTRICRNNQPITAINTIIRGGFIVNDFGGSKTPRITVSLHATDARGNVFMSIQTTISARLIHYK